jgi:hypothetical protein
MGLHCRSLGSAYKGSNPSPTTPGVTALTRGNAGGARSRVSGRVRLCPVAPGGAWRNRPFDEVRDERRSAWPAVPADRSRRAARYCWAAGRTDDRRGRDPALTCGRQVPSPLITHVRMDPDPAGARRAAHHYRRHHRGVLPITAPLLSWADPAEPPADPARTQAPVSPAERARRCQRRRDPDPAAPSMRASGSGRSDQCSQLVISGTRPGRCSR